MEGEVLKIRKELEKTVPKNDFKRALELLRSLESIPMTLDVLTKTHIGMAVNKIRKAADSPEVVSLSKSMVKKWKKLVSASAPSSNNNNNNNNSNSNNNNNNSNSKDPSNNNGNNSLSSSSTNTNNNNSISSKTNDSNSIQSHNATGNNSISTSMQTHSTNATSENSTSTSTALTSSSSGPSKTYSKAPIQTEVPSTTSEVRLKCRQLLTDALKKPLPKDIASNNYSFLEEEILAGRIEESIYQDFKATDMKYKNRIRSKVSNLGDAKNPYLRLNVLLGEISPERIAKMTAEEMASDELKKQREIYTKEAINDHQMSLTTGTKTSEIKCPACKKYNCTYNQVQTRSADEPMTTFCFCNECGKRWKFC